MEISPRRGSFEGDAGTAIFYASASILVNPRSEDSEEEGLA
jgi:hypothetical protein